MALQGFNGIDRTGWLEAAGGTEPWTQHHPIDAHGADQRSLSDRWRLVHVRIKRRRELARGRPTEPIRHERPGAGRRMRRSGTVCGQKANASAPPTCRVAVELGRRMQRESGVSARSGSQSAWHDVWERQHRASSLQEAFHPQGCGSSVRRLLITCCFRCTRPCRPGLDWRPDGARRNGCCERDWTFPGRGRSLQIARCGPSQACCPDSDSQALATLGAARGDHGAAAACLHADQEAVGTGAASL